MVQKKRPVEVAARFDAVMEEFSKLLRHAITRLCPKNLGIQPEDIEQETRLRIWQAIESEREINNLASYIYRIAVTTTINEIRRAKARREAQLHPAEDGGAAEKGMSRMEDPATPPDRLAEQQQVIQKVEEALARLPQDRRRAVGLYLEGWSSQEIADILGWSEPKARNLLYRGLKDLRQRLRVEGIEYEIE